jgi:DNA-binding transcriptional regulator YdaS (Cro superfamily)
MTATRRWGAGTSALVRALVAATKPVSQVELATLVGVSQPRVSQVLGRLRKSSAVTSTIEGYVGRREQLIDLYVRNHRPALVDGEVPWYSLRPMREQVDLLCVHATEIGTRVSVSADLAPDLLVPWRHPTLTIVYADDALDLTTAGFVRAEGRVDATTLVRHTSDTTLLAAFEPWPRRTDGLPLADPVQQIWDLHALGGADRVEAADRLAAAVLDGTLAAAS